MMKIQITMKIFWLLAMSEIRYSAAEDYPTDSDDVGILIELSDVDTSWEECIIGGPTVVALLAQLMAVSSKVDYSILEKVPNYNYTYIKNPSSFRVTLLQVATSTRNAFEFSQSSMHTIALTMANMPTHLRLIKRVIATGKDRVIAIILPRLMKKISDGAAISMKAAVDTRLKLLDIVLLMDELLEVSIVSTEKQDDRLHETRLHKAYVETVRMGVKNTIKRQNDELVAQRKQVEKRRTSFLDALSKIPTGLRAMVGHWFEKAAYDTGESSAPVGTPANDNYQIALVLQPLMEQTKITKEFTLDYFFDRKTVNENPMDVFKAFNVALQACVDSLSDLQDCPQKVPAVTALNYFMGINNKLSDYAKLNIMKKLNVSEQSLRAEIHKFDDLKRDMKLIVDAGAKESGYVTAVKGKMPGNTGNNERFIAEMHYKLLVQAQDRQDHQYANLLTYQEQTTNLMERLSRINFNEMQFEEVLEVMINGTKLLTRVEEQFANVIKFASNIANQAENIVLHNVEPYRSNMEAISDFTKNEIMNQFLEKSSVELHNQAQLLYMMSQTYYDISNRYIMAPMAGLSRLATISSDAERYTIIEKLFETDIANRKNISKLISDRNIAYHKKISDKIAEYEVYLASLSNDNDDDGDYDEYGFGD